MSNFYQSELLSLWHVVTCCLESCVNWEHAGWQTFLFFHVEYKPSKGLKEGQRETGVVGFRDRPFILKGLFTTVISAWGTGYNARYQGIKARFVQQAYFFCWTYWVAFGGFCWCVWKMCLSENPEEHYQCQYLKKKLAWCQLPPLCSFFCWTKPSLQSSFCEWDTIPGSVPSFLLVCVPCVF